MKRTPLKRKTPLRSFSQLKRGPSPLLRKSGFSRSATFNKGKKHRKQGIPQVSAKRRKENDTYKKVREEYLTQHPKCERCVVRSAVERWTVQPSTEIHHRGRRHGKWLCDTRFFVACCRSCHEWIEQNGQAARQQGWLLTPEQIRKLE